MNLITSNHEGHAVIAVDGRLTAAGVPALRAAIQNSIDAGQPRIVIDLAATSFVDSSGLGAIIGGLKAARVAGGDLRIAAVPDAVMSVLRLTNLDRVLRAHPTSDAAFDGD